MRAAALPGLVFVLALTAATVLLFAWPTVADPDSFYHYAHARIYFEQRSFDQSFPWTAFSATGKFDADLWLGIHVFALPFTWLADPVVGLKLAIAVWIAASATVVWFALHRLQPTLAWAAPLLIFFSGGLETGRLLALRPQGLSLALLLLSLSLLVRPSRWWVGAATGFAFAFFHQTLSWMLVPCVLFGFVVSFLLQRQRSSAFTALFLLLGLVVGWCLRPGAIDALTLMRIQIVDLSAARSQGIPLPFGTEVYKLTASELFGSFPVFAVAWIACLLGGAAMVLKRRDRIDNETIALFAISGGLSLAFYQLLLVGSSRGLEYWVATASIVIVNAMVLVGTALPKAAPRWTQVGLGVVILACATPSLISLHGFMTSAAIDPRRFQPVMDAIAIRSKPGDLVWTAQWEIFPELLFWNRKNVYVQGMDPIFLYSSEPAKFWQIQYLRYRKTSDHTFDGPPGPATAQTGLHEVLSQDFRAKWALLIKPATPELAAYMAKAPGFEMVYDDEVVAAYRIDP
ncbi:MAG TPA: hypothetical protein PLL78_10850 [Fimbriimonadaceae bacterium]|nr:hypothetical protein [Fimbriimonadaceae bacterium]HRJ97174.1 hypothetical protein [Fimbriimonadaceae bacterium]